MRKLFIITTAILILAAPITYLIILFIDKILLHYFSFVVVEGSKDAWINFFGTLISGLTTLLALIFTIKNESKKQTKEEIKSIRPFILIQPILHDNFMDLLNADFNTYLYVFSIRIENISNNLVKDLKLVEEQVYEFNEKTKKYDLNQQELLKKNQTNYCIYTPVFDNFEIIAPKRYLDFQINFGVDNYFESSKSSAKGFYVKMIVKYRDAMDKMEYFSQLEFKLTINYSADRKVHIFAENIKNKVIKEIPIKNDNN